MRHCPVICNPATGSQHDASAISPLHSHSNLSRIVPTNPNSRRTVYSLVLTATTRYTVDRTKRHCTVRTRDVFLSKRFRIRLKKFGNLELFRKKKKKNYNVSRTQARFDESLCQLFLLKKGLSLFFILRFISLSQKRHCAA